MKDLQELWSEIPEKSLEKNDVEAILNRKSTLEVDRFKKLLFIELYVSWGLTAALLLMYHTIGRELIVIICLTLFLGSLLNIATLKKLKQLQLLDDVKSFLKKALKVVRAFVLLFILTIQIIGVVVIGTIKFLKQPQVSWDDWFTSSEGISLIGLYIIVEVILISYAWIFYISRIRSMKKLLEEIEN